jgi:integrase
MATIHTLIKGAIRERIGKRGVSYQISLDAENGRQGKRITETFKTYADAEKRLAALENGGRPTSTATVGAWLDYWLERMRADVKHPKRQRTLESYQNAVDKHIRPVIGHLRIAKVRARQLQNLEDESPLSPSAVGQMHSVLKGTFRLAMVDEGIEVNPMREVTPPGRKPSKPELPSLADVRRILELAEDEAGELWPMVQTMAHTGLRRAELCGLRWEDVDLGTGRITVNGQLLRTRELGLIWQAEPKTASGQRTIKADAKTVDVLRGATGRRKTPLWAAWGQLTPTRVGCSPMRTGKRLTRIAFTSGSRHW